MSAFDQYRRLPNDKTTAPRLLAGIIIIAALWLAASTAALIAGFYAYSVIGPWFGPEPLAVGQDGFFDQFLRSRFGFFAMLLTFSGIWLGTWVAMRLLHHERLSHLFGNSGRLSRSGFAKALAAVFVTSALTEIGLYLIAPEINRGPISLSAWLLVLIPVVLVALVQTSAEEILFRGYLLRGLASRFRSPLVWAVIPTVAFSALHWNGSAPLAMNIAIVLSIGAFAVLLAWTVVATGNLGACMGAHLGNNLAGFLLISHESSLSSFTLFRGKPLETLAWTPGLAAIIVAISVGASMLTLLLLVHPLSPLKVGVDHGSATIPGPDSPQS